MTPAGGDEADDEASTQPMGIRRPAPRPAPATVVVPEPVPVPVPVPAPVPAPAPARRRSALIVTAALVGLMVVLLGWVVVGGGSVGSDADRLSKAFTEAIDPLEDQLAVHLSQSPSPSSSFIDGVADPGLRQAKQDLTTMAKACDHYLVELQALEVPDDARDERDRLIEALTAAKAVLVQAGGSFSAPGLSGLMESFWDDARGRIHRSETDLRTALA